MLRDVTRTQGMQLVITVLLLSFALVLIIYTIRNMDASVKSVVQGMQEVKKGNLDVLVQVQSFDEIDTITDNFKVTMFFIKKEKKESYEITFISDEISIGRYLYYLCCIYLL